MTSRLLRSPPLCCWLHSSPAVAGLSFLRPSSCCWLFKLFPIFLYYSLSSCMKYRKINITSIIQCWVTNPSKFSGLKQQLCISHIFLAWPNTSSPSHGTDKSGGSRVSSLTCLAVGACWWLVAMLGLSPGVPGFLLTGLSMCLGFLTAWA
jgi:hypothetical protein